VLKNNGPSSRKRVMRPHRHGSPLERRVR
jgi:hypothetical protein